MKKGRYLIPKFKEDLICELYNQNYTQHEVAVLTSVTRETVKNVLCRNDVFIRSRGQALKGKRHKNCIELDFDIFKRRDRETAYFCGVLMADGTIYAKRNYISLVSTDKDIIVKFANFLQFPLERVRTVYKTPPRKVQYVIGLCHSNFNKDLKPWGIIPNKSYNFIEPKIPSECLAPYLRGWFDGDGSISTIRNYRFSITGHHEAVKWYLKSLRRLGYKGKCTIRHKKENIYSHLAITRKADVKEVINLIKGFPCMDRKRLKCEQGGLL